MIGRFGVLELVLVLAIALIVFGPKKLPEIGKAIGQTIREFRSSTAAKDEESEQEKQAEAAKLSETGGEKAPEGMIESRDPQNQTAEAERPGNRAGTKSDE